MTHVYYTHYTNTLFFIIEHFLHPILCLAQLEVSCTIMILRRLSGHSQAHLTNLELRHIARDQIILFPNCVAVFSNSFVLMQTVELFRASCMLHTTAAFDPL
jgi:hypothetical protein